MSALTNVQIINGLDGNPAFVVIPYADYLKEHALETTTIPNEVVGAIIKQDLTPIQAWRTYLQFSAIELAKRLGLSEAEYIEIENANKPNNATLKKVAAALGITISQLLI